MTFRTFGDKSIPYGIVNNTAAFNAVWGWPDSRSSANEFYHIMRWWQSRGIIFRGQVFHHESTRDGGDDSSIGEFGAQTNIAFAKTGILTVDDGLAGNWSGGAGNAKERSVGLNTTGPAGATSGRGPNASVLYTADTTHTMPSPSSSNNVIGRRRQAPGDIRDQWTAAATSGAELIGFILQHQNGPDDVDIRVGFHGGGSTADRSDWVGQYTAGSDPVLQALISTNTDATKWPTYELGAGDITSGETVLAYPLVMRDKSPAARGLFIFDLQNFGSCELEHHLSVECATDANFATFHEALGTNLVFGYCGANDVSNESASSGYFYDQMERSILRYRAVNPATRFCIFFQQNEYTGAAPRPAMRDACEQIAADYAGVWFGDLMSALDGDADDTNFDANGVHQIGQAGNEIVADAMFDLMLAGAPSPIASIDGPRFSGKARVR